ncbi:antitoxin [Nocardioides terrisoli]|uniref:antitoxin n=1 Tax=Nocardioides terrisoli TaxID=3388267 RepID=UPI00287B973B|nr:antitoxin [Nocardioides marmorisolisilvae]
MTDMSDLGGLADKAEQFAGEHPNQVREGLDKAEQALDGATGGRFGDQIQQGGDMVEERLGVSEQGGGQQADQSGGDQQGDQSSDQQGGGFDQQADQSNDQQGGGFDQQGDQSGDQQGGGFDQQGDQQGGQQQGL